MKAVLAIGLPFIVFGIIAAAIWFVETRLITSFGITRTWIFRSTVAVVMVIAMAAMLGTAKASGAAIGYLNVAGGYIFIFTVYLALCFAVVYFAEMVWEIPKSFTATASILLAFSFTLVGAISARSFRVNEITIPIRGLQRELTIMHMPDIHIGHHRGKEYLKRIVDVTNQRNPDFVSINGDLIDAASALGEDVLAPLSDLKAPAYYVGGNHEKYVGEAEAMRLVAARGVKVLHNEVVEIQGIQLIGLDYMNADEDTFDMHSSDNQETIKSTLPKITLQEGVPVVLMHHSPVGTKYVAEKGVDLMLAGHTHAGQVFPGTLLARLTFPYLRGLYNIGPMKLFVSQGAGTFMIPVRLGSTNEIDLIRLVPDL